MNSFKKLLSSADFDNCEIESVTVMRSKSPMSKLTDVATPEGLFVNEQLNNRNSLDRIKLPKINTNN